MTDQPITADQGALRALIDKAVEAHRQGRFDEAETLYRQALALDGREPNALANLGALSIQRGDLQAGVDLIETSLSVKPAQPFALTNQANGFLGLGRLEQALHVCRQGLALEPAQPPGQVLLGDILLRFGRGEEALQAYLKAIDLRPDHAETLFKAGVVLSDLKRWAEAEVLLKRAAGLAPEVGVVRRTLSMVLRAQGRLEEALAESERAVALGPGDVDALIQRGCALRELGRPHEALQACEAALALQPDHADALANTAIVLGDLRRNEEALAFFDKVEAINPAYPRLVWIRSLAQLMLGRYAEGWRGHEERLRANQRGLANRQWTGGPVEGRTVLVHAEQGLGDTLQMVRYLPLLAARGARVVLMAQRPLVTLLQSVEGTEVIGLDDPVPPFDLQIATLSLPMAFDTRLETIPAEVPYIAAPSDRVAAWRRRIDAETPGPALRVGLIWSGGFRADQPETWALNKRRNVALRRLESLKTPGVVFYSLQKGEAAEAELAEVKANGWAGPDIVDWTAGLQDMSDTAALMACMDLVITVDTSMAHLAGALGRPVWILNRYDSCWRWLQDRSDSPWYPTARVFRQAHPDGLEAMIAEAKQALQDLALSKA